MVRWLIRAGGIVTSLAVLLTTPLTFAEDFTSSSFKTTNPLTNSYGGIATSTGFQSLLSGGQMVTGESTSTNFVLHMGSMYFDSYEPKSQNWRWYGDETNETPTSALALENVAPTNVENVDSIKLRIAVAETADIGSTGVKLRLQFSTASDFSSGVYFVADQSMCVGGSAWCYADGAGADNALITTGLLSDTDSCVASVGDGCGTHNEYATTSSAHTHVKSAIAEYEFTIQQYGAEINTVYFFRLVDVVSSSTVPLNTGESYPSLVTGGSSLEFTINGINSGTATEGDTTAVTTTSTTIPFGSLALDTPVVAAQRLTVSTNGTQGYKVYAYERQAFLSEVGATIAPVSGTNETPVGWSTGCDISAEGCYGYHSGEDVLEGGSTRFAANDTFAQFSDEPREVAFNSGPIENKSTDILYRVQVRDQQEGGIYNSSIVYIVTPIF